MKKVFVNGLAVCFLLLLITSCNSNQEESAPVLIDKEQIKKDIEAGNQPFYVNATIGTTVLSAIDPVDEIANICEKYNISIIYK